MDSILSEAKKIRERRERCKGVSKEYWYFITLTQSQGNLPEGSYGLTSEEFIEVIEKKFKKSKATDFKILHLEGCLEHHQSGVLHAHLLIQGDRSPRRGFKDWFQHRWSYGKVDAQRVDFKSNPNSLQDIRNYLAKEEFVKF